ncbi:hypothetical protein P171DRAFT_524171 [Karstenula rhodostoma CBS 690.94]|uniref:Uncharacterized protein n=1 Tax=Karstenula rhodostoma CBS 690.94 TaxID=1392251 RepID=A0A9P4U9M1_9PLEO|nr:hypothetical protein P171DRAFT_524171 [Karstenula rhodostoma CBS 690.94]
MERGLDQDSESSQHLWPKSFHEDRNPAEEETFLESRLRINPNDDPLLTFLRDYDEDTAEEEVITHFCSSVHHSALTNPCATHSQRAWLDDRQWRCTPSSNSPRTPAQDTKNSVVSRSVRPMVLEGKAIDIISKDIVDEPRAKMSLPKKDKQDQLFREYNSPLDAPTLFRNLMQKRFAHDTLPEADRRLIYVSGLTPVFVYALIKTATQHQSAALKTALYMHIARKIDLGVKISYKKYDAFELYLYIPFPTLNMPESNPNPLGEQSGSFRPELWDISSITSSGPQSSGETSHILQMGHIAINICGIANCRWAGYAFVDGDEEMDEEDFDYTGMVQDQFAANGDVNANDVIWDPREYFLLIVLIRVEKVIRAWSWLIQKIETSHQEDMLSSGIDDADNEDTAMTFRRTQKAVKTLGMLHDVLSETNGCWNDFLAPDGDIIYFEKTEGLSITSRTQMSRCLSDLRSKFRKMRALQRRLETIERRYQRAVDSLERRLSIDSNRAAKSSGAHAQLMVAWISPVAIASAVFSIPAPFGSFPRTGASFTIAMLIVAVILRLLIFVQYKQWWLQKTWLRRSYREGTSQPTFVCNQHNEERRIPQSRANTAETLVGSEV